MQKIIFQDDSYIEKNESGHICVGWIANEVGALMRRFDMTIKELSENRDIQRVMKI